jgi:hypothetical protein
MVQISTKPQDLVMTEAEPAPPPESHMANRAERGAVEVGPEVLTELKCLAERVGGLKKLRELIDVLLEVPR